MIDATAWESVRINRQSTDDHLDKAEGALAFRRHEEDAENVPPSEKALNQLFLAFREMDGRLRRLEAIGYGQWKEAGRKQVPRAPDPVEDPPESEKYDGVRMTAAEAKALEPAEPEAEDDDEDEANEGEEEGTLETVSDLKEVDKA